MSHTKKSLSVNYFELHKMLVYFTIIT